ncbi:MAG: hypothetical protein ACLFWD_13260 [Anaerolineales bacterium]
MKLFRAAILTLCLALLTIAPPASAEGPGTGGRRVMINDEVVNGYMLRVVTSPTPPRVESLYVEVRVLNAEDQRPITDARVHARAEPTEIEARPVESQATHDIAPIPTEYAAHLPVGEPGVWRVTITVEGDSGPAEVSFLTRVGGSAALGAALAVGLPVAGLAILIGVFLYLQREHGEQPPEKKLKEERPEGEFPADRSR